MAVTDPGADAPQPPDAGVRKPPRAAQLSGRFLASAAAWFLLATMIWPQQTLRGRSSESVAFAVAELIGDLFFFRPSPSSRQRTAMQRHVRRGTVPPDEDGRARLVAYVASEREKAQPLWRTASIFGPLAAAAVAWGMVRGGTGQLAAGVGLAAFCLLHIPRERLDLGRLQRMDRMLEPAREPSLSGRPLRG
ncbi:MAG: hypothetical protein QOF82_2838 [Frankiales bacterium]|nr:hypothetical protein [Frankiales bacterium]